MSERIAFSRQPARTVLVDMREPFNRQLCNNLCESLQHVFSLVANLTGWCRVPFFSLVALANQPQCLYTLQHVKGSFTKLYQSIEAMKSTITGQIRQDCVALAIEQSVIQFKRQMQTLSQAPRFSVQLEITLVTTQSVQTARNEAERIIQNLQCDHIKKVTIVHVRVSDTFGDHEVPETLDSPEPDDLSDSGLIDTVECEGDVLSFENYFKRWLHDGSSDQEHLHLFLPTILSKKLLLKCDIQERLLNPKDLPSQYQTHLVATVQERCGTATPRGKTAGKQLEPQQGPVYQIRAVRLIKTESVCESVLYGQPSLVRPTACWKLEWEELESNQQNFYALCSLLFKRGMSLLAIEDETTTGPKGHFLLVPSSKATLLLKSIAVSELVLPYDFQLTQSKPQEDAFRLVERSLSKLMVTDGYNPLTTSSGLYACLSAASVKSTPATRPLKRKFQTPKLTGGSLVTGQISEPERPNVQTQRHHPLGMKGKKSTVMTETVNTVQEEAELFEEDPHLPVYKPYYKQLPGKSKFPRKW